MNRRSFLRLPLAVPAAAAVSALPMPVMATRGDPPYEGRTIHEFMTRPGIVASEVVWYDINWDVMACRHQIMWHGPGGIVSKHVDQFLAPRPSVNTWAGFTDEFMAPYRARAAGVIYNEMRHRGIVPMNLIIPLFPEGLHHCKIVKL